MDFQSKLYTMLDQLKNMAAEIPPKYQMRLPIELLSSLANCLLNETIFEIVKGLMEIQHMTEKQLHDQRCQIVERQKFEFEDLQNKNLELEQFLAKKAELQKKHENELKQADIKIIMQLDQKVTDQQITLEKAGVPGFYVTEKTLDITIQMYLIHFILTLSKLQS